MRMIESAKVPPLVRLLLMNHPKADKIIEGIQEIVDIHTVDAVPVDTVAEMFYDFTGDSCACDFNGNDEWLSEVCELQDECPYPKDKLGCWKQYIKHYRGNCDD